MNIERDAFTSDYLLSTRSITFAGKRLRTLIDSDRSRLEYAIIQLEQASKRQGEAGTGLSRFMFSDLEAVDEMDLNSSSEVAESTLAIILTDIQVSDLLIAAGRSVGEGGPKSDPRFLDESLRRLDNTLKSIETPLSNPLTVTPSPGRFGFAGEHEVVEMHSADLSSAIDDFKRKSEETLAILLNESHKSIDGVLKLVSKLDEKNVLEALSNLEKNVKGVHGLGRLIQQGIKKLENAVNSFINLLGKGPLEYIKPYLEKAWKAMKEGSLISSSLETAFGIEETRSIIKDILNLKGLTIEGLDASSTQLSRLQIAYKESMSIIRMITAGLILAESILALTSFAAPQLALFLASAYVVTMAGIFLIGMDYADSENVMRRVRGIRMIAQDLNVKGGPHG